MILAAEKREASRKTRRRESGQTRWHDSGPVVKGRRNMCSWRTDRGAGASGKANMRHLERLGKKPNEEWEPCGKTQA